MASFSSGAETPFNDFFTLSKLRSSFLVLFWSLELRLLQRATGTLVSYLNKILSLTCCILFQQRQEEYVSK
jgi:hypothetical protein